MREQRKLIINQADNFPCGRRLSNGKLPYQPMVGKTAGNRRSGEAFPPEVSPEISPPGFVWLDAREWRVLS